MAGHKNSNRAPTRPLDARTLALTAGGLGFLRPAPGTWGTVPPVLVVALLAAAGADVPLLYATALVMLVAASAVCVCLGGFAERRFGRKDASEVVADEVAGVCLPLIAAVAMTDASSERLLALGVAFALFRLFDISKPWPLRRLEKLPGGWGVLADDLMAGVYAALVIVIGARFVL